MDVSDRNPGQLRQGEVTVWMSLKGTGYGAPFIKLCKIIYCCNLIILLQYVLNCCNLIVLLQFVLSCCNLIILQQVVLNCCKLIMLLQFLLNCCNLIILQKHLNRFLIAMVIC